MTQVLLSDDESNKVSKDKVADFFEEKIGDIGFSYTPLNSETGEEWHFSLFGFYKHIDMLKAERFHHEDIIGDGNVKILVEATKPWFCDLYPPPQPKPAHWNYPEVCMEPYQKQFQNNFKTISGSLKLICDNNLLKCR